MGAFCFALDDILGVDGMELVDGVEFPGVVEEEEEEAEGGE
jgi:hypothetical protein